MNFVKANISGSKQCRLKLNKNLTSQTTSLYKSFLDLTLYSESKLYETTLLLPTWIERLGKDYCKKELNSFPLYQQLQLRSHASRICPVASWEILPPFLSATSTKNPSSKNLAPLCLPRFLSATSTKQPSSKNLAPLHPGKAPQPIYYFLTSSW